MFVRSPTGRFVSLSASVCFSTASDSPVSADSSTCSQSLERAFGPILLGESQQGCEQDDHGDNDGLGRVPEHRRQRDSNEQDDDQHVLELFEQQLPCRDRRGGVELVGAVLGQPVRGLLSAQARTRRGLKPCYNDVETEAVPGIVLVGDASGGPGRRQLSTSEENVWRSFVGLSWPDPAHSAGPMCGRA
jgi:hypothetical protein